MAELSLCQFLVVFSAALSVAGPALAHPHVWVNAKAEVIFDGDGNLAAIRHTWLFDADFSAYATVNVDADKDGKLSQAELKPLVETNMKALKEYDFFTHLYVDNKSLAFDKPVDYHLEFHSGRLTLFYTLPLKAPLSLHGTAMLEIGDPEYFVAIDFVKNQEIKLGQSPPGCSVDYRPPHDLDAQTMAILSAVPIDQHDLPPNLVQAASLLQNVFTINCPRAQLVGAGKPNSQLQVPQVATSQPPVIPADPVVQPPTDGLTKTNSAGTHAAAEPDPERFAEETAPAASLSVNSVAANSASSAQPQPASSPARDSSSENWFARVWHRVFGR